MSEKVKRNREATEQKLIDVAIKMIRENGVLAGLNLREVAEGAGVNRGNIYHYFGSRQELLRAAIARRFTSMTKAIVREPFVKRRLRAFRQHGSFQDSQLRALLVVDGDSEVDPMPMHEEMLSLLRRDVIDGHIDPSHDLEALQVALNSLLRGYRIFHEQYARRIDTDTDDLDRRVSEIVRVWLKAMKQPNGVNTQ